MEKNDKQKIKIENTTFFAERNGFNNYGWAYK